MSQTCPKCQTVNADEAKFCKNCGFNIQEEALKTSQVEQQANDEIRRKSTERELRENRAKREEAEKKKREQTALPHGIKEKIEQDGYLFLSKTIVRKNGTWDDYNVIIKENSILLVSRDNGISVKEYSKIDFANEWNKPKDQDSGKNRREEIAIESEEYRENELWQEHRDEIQKDQNHQDTTSTGYLIFVIIIIIIITMYNISTSKNSNQVQQQEGVPQATFEEIAIEPTQAELQEQKKDEDEQQAKYQSELAAMSPNDIISTTNKSKSLTRKKCEQHFNGIYIWNGYSNEWICRKK
jgi:hypothetical protein